jgi:ABC-type multidrug transport system ATPase subunit
MTTEDVVIETRGLSKRYGDLDALRELDLRVPAGSIYGYLGRNGAGKTTTIKTLMGLIRPTAGEARVFGCHADDPYDGVAIRRRTAHVGEDRVAWPATARDERCGVLLRPSSALDRPRAQHRGRSCVHRAVVAHRRAA